jgi:hypothetical protein
MCSILFSSAIGHSVAPNLAEPGHQPSDCSPPSEGEQRSLDYPRREAALVEGQVGSVHLVHRGSILPCMFF